MEKKIAQTFMLKNDKAKFTDNTTFNQRKKLLNYLKTHRSITTQTAREVLDIYYPPSRISELRKEGYSIHTIWDYWISDYGIKHRIGRYVLSKEKLEDDLVIKHVHAKELDHY